MAHKKHVQPCTALLRDGSKCGKYAKVGQLFCSVHSPGYTPRGAAVARPRPVSYEDRLRQFAESNDPRVSMAAIAQLERRKSADVGATSAIRWDDMLAACTDAERAELRAVMDEFRRIKEGIWARRPDLRPAWASAPTQSGPREHTNGQSIAQRDEPTRSATEVPEPTAVGAVGPDSVGTEEVGDWSDL